MYKERSIKFKELKKINGWVVKVYTISKDENFNSPDIYSDSLDKLPGWLNQLNSFNSSHENIAFIILHEGTEGVFTLVNTWVGENMLQTHIFITKYDNRSVFTKISGDGLSACIWELEIIHHESKAWIKHVLKNDNQDNYKAYLSDVINIRT